MTNHPTPEQACEQLSAVQARSITSERDRSVHALATAVFGATTAFYMASQNILAGGMAHAVKTVAFIALWLLVAWWIERAAKTVPRRARLWSRTGIAGSFVLSLIAVLPWLNHASQSADNTWPMVALGAVLAAAPALVAAAAIRWISR
ncbi:hypothetical protein DC347_05510 [Pseudarthrobacter sp. AG30]|uniref:hypothetical protein n=1 Tax=Pseudarthrobacter sp. AG30 TaxID=2249742 RepID=UPI000D64B1F3|nr:hypothetical protein [Pseudarthrobacter sp. AG30]RAX18166.1 hypothetical protein DC347_05510 [Pseudarthrobacter sp. AG30]